MLNFVELNEQEVSQLLKFPSEKDYKKGIGTVSLHKNNVFAAFQKTTLDRVSYNTYRNYVKTHLSENNNELVDAYFGLIRDKIIKTFPEERKLVSFFEDGKKTFDSLTEADWEELKKYEAKYDTTGIPLSFESFIRLHCNPSEATVEKKKSDEQSELIAKLQNDYENAQHKIEELTAEKTALAQEKSKMSAEINTLKQQNQNYISILSGNNAMKKLTKIFPELNGVVTVDEAYAVLNKKENECWQNSRYDELQEILAAKYAIASVLREGK